MENTIMKISVNFCWKFLKFLPHVVYTYVCTCAILKFLKKKKKLIFYGN